MGKSRNPKDNWFDEFKKCNENSDAPPPPKDPLVPTSPSPTVKGKDTERRKYPRFGVEEANTTLYKDGLLTIVGIGKANKARFATDISEGGARLMVTERLQPGTKIKIKIEMEKYSDTIEATGEIRWCYQSAKTKTDFFAGVRFFDLDDPTRRKINLMREWFTSSQYRQVRESKLRQQKTPSDIIKFPK